MTRMWRSGNPDRRGHAGGFTSLTEREQTSYHRGSCGGAKLLHFVAAPPRQEPVLLIADAGTTRVRVVKRLCADDRVADREDLGKVRIAWAADEASVDSHGLMLAIDRRHTAVLLPNNASGGTEVAK